MRAGPLRHRMAVQTATETRDDQGGVTQTWVTDKVRWCSIEPIRGREFFESNVVGSDITHRVVMRYFDGLTSKQRLLGRSAPFTDVVFNIEGPPRDMGGRQRMLEVMARQEG